MNRRDILKATGASMIASQLPAQAAAGNWDRARLEQAAKLMGDWIADGRVAGASILVTQGGGNLRAISAPQKGPSRSSCWPRSPSR